MATYEIAIVLLVDRSGALLMQLRDEHAPVSPNQWAMPGGRIEPGETPAEAAVRELFEETGLTVDAVEHFWSGPRPHEEGFPHQVTMHAFYASTDAEQEDVVLGEGLAMVFIPREETLDRDLAVSAKLLVPMFLESPQYAGLLSPTAG
ncbi:MAG: NUDIX domain-containing protein [Hamadaea sp.]|nr:NUDIX domain-containing protein [Hamadaea sp.]